MCSSNSLHLTKISTNSLITIAIISGHYRHTSDIYISAAKMTEKVLKCLQLSCFKLFWLFVITVQVLVYNVCPSKNKKKRICVIGVYEIAVRLHSPLVEPLVMYEHFNYLPTLASYHITIRRSCDTFYDFGSIFIYLTFHCLHQIVLRNYLFGC